MKSTDFLFLSSLFCPVGRKAACHSCDKYLSASGTEFSTAVLVTQISALRNVLEFAAILHKISHGRKQ
jgi:hypothetical protein